MEHLNSVLIMSVGVIWGITNPFLEKHSKGVEDKAAEEMNLTEKKGEENSEQNLKEKENNPSRLMSFLHILTNWRFILAFLLNQLGSGLYVYSLGDLGTKLYILYHIELFQEYG